MECELLHRVLAHSSLILYIGVLTGMLISLKRLIVSRTTKYAYVILCFCLALALKDIVYFFGDIWYNTKISYILMSIDIWPLPVVTTLLIYILQPNWLNKRRLTFIMLPFVLFTLLNAVFRGNDIIYLTNEIYAFIFASAFGTIIFLLTYKCDKYIDANYSNKDLIDIKWIRYLIILLYVICIIWAFVSINITWLGDTVYYLSTTILVSTLFYLTFNHKNIVIPNYMSVKDILTVDIEESMNFDKLSNMSNKCYEDIEAKIKTAIYEDKVYLNPHLSLSDLASHIGTNRTYLSRYINNYKSTPFINFINDFRLSDAERLLKYNPEHLSISEISNKCGFASYSTFRRVFKQKYGYSPSVWADLK